jgi:hypothetical protein
MRVAAHPSWPWIALLVAATWFLIVGMPSESARDVSDEAAFRIEFIEERIHISVDLDGTTAGLDVAAAPPRESGTSQASSGRGTRLSN